MTHHIAIVGSGQLARMIALDGIPLGISFSFLAEPGDDTRCVQGLGDVVERTAEHSAAELFEKLGKPEVVTVEKEHVDIELLSDFSALCAVHPNPNALAKFKNRLQEKQFLQQQGIPLAPFMEVSNKEQLLSAIEQLSKPIFLKSQEQGYDGYNQYRITDDNAEEILNTITFPSAWVAESFVPFEREISFIAARSPNQEVAIYPAVENYHKNGVLLTSLAPAPNVHPDQLAMAKQYIAKIMDSLDYVGLMCMECFVEDGKILVNEIAPRVHNSGHWTSRGAKTSQFENHIRAILSLPLGATECNGISGMLNLLGATLMPDEALDNHTFLTLYNKTVRPRRKLGHITINHDEQSVVLERLKVLEQMVYNEED